MNYIIVLGEHIDRLNEDRIFDSLHQVFYVKDDAKRQLRQHVLDKLEGKLGDRYTYNAIINWHGEQNEVTYNMGILREEKAIIMPILETKWRRENDLERERKNLYIKYITRKLKQRGNYIDNYENDVDPEKGAMSLKGIEFRDVSVDTVIIKSFHLVYYSEESQGAPAMVVKNINDGERYMVMLESLSPTKLKQIAQVHFKCND